MILSVVDFILVVQWVTLQFSEDLMWLVGKTMENKVNSRMLAQKEKSCDQAYCIQ